MELCIRKNGILAIMQMSTETADQLQKYGFIDEWQEFEKEDFINAAKLQQDEEKEGF